MFLEVLIHGPLARTTIANRLDRSLARVSRVVATLIEAGLVAEGDAYRAESGGRPLVPLSVVPDVAHFLGFKLTADTLFSVVTNFCGDEVAEHSTPLPDHNLDTVVQLIGADLRYHREKYPKIASIGISLGGHTIDRSFVKRAPFLDWVDVPLGQLVEDATSTVTWVENDVRALVQAEHWFGAGRGRESFALLTIGAGVGLGIVANNAIVAGAQSSAGSVGHQQISGSKATCELGHEGCARAVLATSFVVARASRAIGRDVTFAEVLALNDRGDKRVRKICDDAGFALGRLLADVANVIDPGLIVVSGEGVGLAHAAEEAMHAGLAFGKHWASTAPSVVLADFDFSEWARGAAAVAIQMHILGPLFAEATRTATAI